MQVIRRTFLIIFLTVILSATVQKIEAGIVCYAESNDSLINGNGWSIFNMILLIADTLIVKAHTRQMLFGSVKFP
jgi:hypothetical protein